MNPVSLSSVSEYVWNANQTTSFHPTLFFVWKKVFTAVSPFFDDIHALSVRGDSFCDSLAFLEKRHFVACVLVKASISLAVFGLANVVGGASLGLLVGGVGACSTFVQLAVCGVRKIVETQKVFRKTIPIFDSFVTSSFLGEVVFSVSVLFAPLTTSIVVGAACFGYFFSLSNFLLLMECDKPNQENKEVRRKEILATARLVEEAYGRIWKEVEREKIATCSEEVDFLKEWRQVCSCSTTAEMNDYLIQYMKDGICKGETSVLLGLMPQYFDADSGTLLEKMIPQEAVYHQLLHVISVKTKRRLYRQLGANIFAAADSGSRFPEHLRGYKERYKKTIALLEKIDRWKCFDAVVQQEFSKEVQISSEEGSSFLKNTFAKHGENGCVVAGIVDLPKHVFFFQSSNGKYRFYDSRESWMGFYDFSSQEELIKGLGQHLQYNYPNKRVKFELYWLKKEGSVQSFIAA
ncbi:hypothetical protein JYU14_00625 [Simkania negevensis]|uniref:Peptidase C58 YopT-type domain-containing protein n=1 Tax=Simkania negevensis TaxID=83561 RepID=A0ABS3API6_9BACT|nr:hypothetical protein [Simkania negevensis]